MIRFLDGPAEGVVLELRNAPEMLRVVRDPAGTWDALDAPGDEPRPDEKVFLYRRVRLIGFAHIDYVTKDRRRAAKTIARAEYRFQEQQDEKRDD
jgi:hypothetical protein